MANDLKYGRITAEHGGRVHGKPGVPLNESDEPVFVLRAQDVTSGATLAEYRRQSETYGASPEHLASLDEAIQAFARWQDENAALVKVPD